MTSATVDPPEEPTMSRTTTKMLTDKTSEPPTHDFDTEHNCPRGKFSVELLNVMHPRLNGWREVVAAKKNIDFYGHPIQLGERHFFRSTGPGFGCCERLTVLSMDRLLWLTFGGNRELVEACEQMAAQRKAVEAQQVMDCMGRHIASSGGST